MKLNGKTALVTGARRGIGQAIALGLAKAGADLMVNSKTISDRDEVVSQIRALGRRALALPADVAEAGQVAKMVADGLAVFGRIDLLVNNAGIYPAAPLVDIEEKQWDEVIDVNLKGTFLVTQAVARQAMIPQRRSAIINITSCDGKVPTAGIAHYAAAKAGVISLTKSFALELAPFGITANAVAPGWVKTPAVLSSDRWREAIKNIPAGRLADPEEIARVVQFLAEDESGYITGEILDVNGGLIMD
ncbi:MAG: SDR family NAD(P)-dependent oxidoreductase [Thermodesulfobacteriota bacterium]